MNPEIKAKWVAALRSGKYKQGSGYLRQGVEFCCLGVLCDVYAKNVRGRWRAVDGAVYKAFYGYNITLPELVMAWAKLEDDGGGDVEISGKRDSLWSHNDNGRTFAEIADAIEAQL